jgi:flavoprotein hydroxylase
MTALGFHERRTVDTFEVRWADTWRQGRVLIAGDAAHQMPPFAGQGMCSGLRDAANLSWKLDFVLYGLADQALLDTYTTERRQDLQNAIQQSVFHPQGLTGGLLTCGADGALLPPAGQLSRQGRVRFQGRTGLFDQSVGTGFMLLATQDPHDVLDKACLTWCKQLGIRLLRITGDHTAGGPADVVDLDGVYLSLLAGTGQMALLIRPDFYIFGGAAHPREMARLITTLCNKLTRQTAAVRSTSTASSASDLERKRAS